MHGTDFGLTMMFNADEDFEGFHVIDEKISNLITYTKGLSGKSLNKLEEADKEMLNIDNDVPFVHSLSDGKIAEIVLNTDKHEDGSEMMTL